MKTEIKTRLWHDDAVAMGPGKADLLEAIAATGSISGAGRAMKMSYRRAWQRNVRASLLPGAICGLLLAMQIFTVFHYDVSAGVVPGALLAVGLFLLLGLGEFLFAQVVLLDLPFAGLVKNSLFLFLGYLPRAALGVVWQFVYWIIILLLWPISGFAMVLTGLWLPAVLTMQAIYPVLNKAFDLERQIKAIRDAELDSSSDSDN